MLPQKDYIPAIDKNRSLRNLEFPLDWEAIVDYVGFPAILKPADGGGWRDVTVVRNARRAAARLRRVRHERDDAARVHRLRSTTSAASASAAIASCRSTTTQAHRAHGLRGRYIFHDDDDWLPRSCTTAS
jgi:hypothetical protein